MEGGLHEVIEVLFLDDVIEMGWDAKGVLKHLDVVDEGFGGLIGLRFWMDDFDEFCQIRKLFVGLFAKSLKNCGTRPYLVLEHPHPSTMESPTATVVRGLCSPPGTSISPLVSPGGSFAKSIFFNFKASIDAATFRKVFIFPSFHLCLFFRYKV